LMDTFLVRTLLVPSTVVLLGRWNWWPSKMSRASAELPVEAVPVQVKGSPGDRSGDEGTAEPRQPDRHR
jgi:putative drug exporter of the RND superfamily